MENQRIRYKVIDIKTDEKKNTITLSVKNEAEKLYSSTMPSYEVDFDIQPLYIFGRPPQGRSNRVKYYGHLCTENFDYLKIGEIYRFIVVDLYDTKSGTKYAVVIDDRGNNHSVKLLEWQKNVNLQQKIPCRVDKILEDRVRLSQDIPNLKHPYLIEGRKYLFAIEDVSIIESDYFTVTDSKGNSHRTYISRELVREIKEKKGNFIHLYFTGLSKAGELQLNYFNSFHDIIPFRFLKQNVFDSLFEKEFKTDTEEKIIQDYNCFDNRWVLTYANYLNSEIKHKLFNEESLESAYLSCEVYKRLEEWIVSSNYLKLFSENKSKDIKKTANNEIVRINRLIEAIDLIQIEQDLFYVEYSNDEWSKYFSICILIFEYYLKKEDAIVSHKESLFCFYKKAIEQKLEKYQYTEINRVLDRHAYIITKSGKLDAVSFNTSSIETYADNESVDRLCKIMHFQIILGVSESNNIVYICSKILAIINCYSKLVKEQSHRTNLLNNGVRFFGHLLMSSTNTSIVNKIRSSIDYKAILEIVTSTEVYNSDVGVARYQSNAILEIPKTISTSENVLIGNLDGTLCFVNSKSSLSKNISKNSRLLYVDSSNGVLCLAETVESVGAKDIAELIEGDQYKAIVKSIVEYGIFVRVGQYEGLIHKSKISPIRTNKITGLFSIGEELDVVLSSIKSVNEGAEVNYNFSRKVVKSYEKDFKRISKNKLYKVKIFSIDKYRGIEFEFIDFNIRGHLDKRELDLGRDYEELFRIGEILDVHYVQKKELITGDFVAVCKVNVSKIASTPSKMSVRPLSISKVEGYQWLIKKREVICQNCYSKNNNINILEISNNILICEKCNRPYHD
ncbi:MAG: putative RNA-binding protein with RPS1 domain [Arenicella sp.]|jgi:predicted RNA-binding protein with RPS1 domain